MDPPTSKRAGSYIQERGEHAKFLCRRRQCTFAAERLCYHLPFSTVSFLFCPFCPPFFSYFLFLPHTSPSFSDDGREHTHFMVCLISTKDRNFPTLQLEILHGSFLKLKKKTGRILSSVCILCGLTVDGAFYICSDFFFSRGKMKAGDLFVFFPFYGFNFCCLVWGTFSAVKCVYMPCLRPQKVVLYSIFLYLNLISAETVEKCFHLRIPKPEKVLRTIGK